MNLSKTDQLQTIRSKIRNVPDFPEPGIQFKDITPILKDAETLRITSELLIEPFKDTAIDYVAGIESRGFLLGTRLAQDLQAGFIPVRKPGKLPAETVSANYELEYGSETVEMHADALTSGDKVLIHDDLIATGGSARAAAELVHNMQAVVVGFSFIIELEHLKGLKKLPKEPITDVLISL